MNFKRKMTAAATALCITATSLGFISQSMPKASAAAGSSEAIKLVDDMGEGWNLGNSLDSWDSSVTTFNSIEQHQQDWGQPLTTKEMIDAIRDAGFKTVRIPVSWWQEMDGSHKVKPEWMARVKEIVDWVTEDGMYAIVNIHHDGGTGTTGFLKDDFSNKDEYVYLVNQICDTFKDYDNHLILESANELTWKNADGTYNYTDLNALNQTFVDTVRASGGENAKRLLLLAGACTDLNDTCNEKFVVPNDPMVAVSIHYYLPSNWCVESAEKPWTWTDSEGKVHEIPAQTTWGSDDDYNQLAQNFAKMNDRFASKGVPVILGETGVCEFAQRSWDDINEYTKAVYSMCDSFPGFTTCLWDACYSEDVGYFNRKTLKWTNKSFEDTIKSVTAGNYTDYSKCFSKSDTVTVKGTTEKDMVIDQTTHLKSIDLTVTAPKGFLIALTHNDGSGKWVYARFTQDGPDTTSEGATSAAANKTVTKNADGTYTIHAEYPDGSISGSMTASVWYSDGTVTYDNAKLTYYGETNSFDKSKAVEVKGNEKPPVTTTTTAKPVTTTTTLTTTKAPTTTTAKPEETTAKPEETTTLTSTEAPKTTTTVTTTEVEPTTETPPTAAKYGDVNCDGTVNISDVVLLNKSIVGASKLNDAQRRNAEVNADGNITADDSVIILKYLINIIKELPYKG